MVSLADVTQPSAIPHLKVSNLYVLISEGLCLLHKLSLELIKLEQLEFSIANYPLSFLAALNSSVFPRGKTFSLAEESALPT